MIRNLTPFNVLGYVYNDLDKKDSEKVMTAMIANENLADEFIELSEAKELLDKCSYSASQVTLNRILDYSKSQMTESAH